MKRLFYIILIVASGLLIYFLAAQKREKEEIEAKGSKPNIIYILADDLGYGDIGTYGQEKIETPNIDRLATSGITFTDHYAGAPVCAPSRCVLLTGKHLGHSHIRGNDEWAARGEVWDYAKAVEDPNLEGQRPLPEGTYTIGSLLQNAGYKTAIIGKWGLGAPLTEGIPTNRGFDFFFGYNCQRQAHTYYPKHLWKNEEKIWLDNELVVPGTKLSKDEDPLDESSYAKYNQKDYSPRLMQMEAVNFIRENSKNGPFFLYYATPIPHAALQAPKRWVDYYVDKFGDEEPYDGSKGYFPVRYPKATYAAMISYLDEQVGELVDVLKELGIYDNTLIIFTSDNGPTYNGGTNSPWFNSGGLFRSEYGFGKGFVQEGGIRVPMIASWPGIIESESMSNHISAFYDVLPTLCDVAGVETPDDADGTSFLPALTGLEQSKKEYYYWEYPEYGGQIAIRMGNWKGIAKNIKKTDKITFELFDLENDIREENNVSEEHPEIIEKFHKIIITEHKKSELERFRIKQIDRLFEGNLE